MYYDNLSCILVQAHSNITLTHILVWSSYFLKNKSFYTFYKFSHTLSFTDICTCRGLLLSDKFKDYLNCYLMYKWTVGCV